MRAALIVSGGGFQGLGLWEALQCIPGVRPIIADTYADNVTRYLCADYVQIPPLSERDAFVASLSRLVREYGVQVVFPATARELPLLAQLAPILATSGVRTAVSSPQLIDILLDKCKTTAFLHGLGIPAQMSVDPAAHDFSTLLFGKPRHGWGGTGTATARSAEEAIHHEASAGEGGLVWFPLVAGFEEYSADFAILESGDVSPVVLRRRVRTSGGYAVITESVCDSAILALAEATAGGLAKEGGLGIFNVQVIAPQGVAAFVSDVNPRFGTSAVHGLAEGLNLAGFFLDAAPGSQPSARQPAKTVRHLKTIALPLLQVWPKGVVFDLDDTLVDHKLWMAAKVIGAHREAAHAWVGEAEFLAHALQLIDEGEKARLIDRLAECFSWREDRRLELLAAYRNADPGPTPLYPDVRTVLADLVRAGFKLAILTDNPPTTQRAKLARSGVSDLFSATVFAREVGGEKPCAAAFAAAAEALSLPPGELCMVGDNYFRDALGAIRNGYAAAFVLRRDGSFLRSHGGITGLIGHPGRIHPIDSLVALREVLVPA